MARTSHSILRGAGLLVSAPDACQIDSYLFLSGRFGLNLETNAIPLTANDVPEASRKFFASRYVDAVEWPVTAQTWWIYEAFRRILEPFGADLRNLVRTNTYFRDLRDFTAMERTRAVLLPVAPPASTVLEIPFGHFPVGVDVAIEAVAVIPGTHRESVPCPAVGTGDHFSWGIRTPDVVWVTGQTPTHPLRPEYVHRVADLGVDQTYLATGNPHTAQREGPSTAQAWMAYWRVRKIVEDAGATVNDIIYEKIYLRSLKYVPAVERMYQTVYPDLHNAPPRLYLEVCNIGRTPDCRLEIDVIASRTGREAIPGHTDGLGRFGASAALGGPFLSLGGRVARDKITGRVVGAREDLGERHHVLQGDTRPLAVQSLWIYDELRDFLEQHGSSLSEIAKLELFVPPSAPLSALDTVHRIVFPDGPPAISVIPVAAIDSDPHVEIKISGFGRRPPK